MAPIQVMEDHVLQESGLAHAVTGDEMGAARADLVGDADGLLDARALAGADGCSREQGIILLAPTDQLICRASAS